MSVALLLKHAVSSRTHWGNHPMCFLVSNLPESVAVGIYPLSTLWSFNVHLSRISQNFP